MSEVSPAPSKGRKWNFLFKDLLLKRNTPQANAPAPWLLRRDLTFSSLSKSNETQSHLPGCGAWAGMRGPMLRRPHTGFNALLVLVIFRQRSSFSHLALGPENHVASTGDNQHVRALKTFLQKASFLMERKAEIRKYHNCFQFLLWARFYAKHHVQTYFMPKQLCRYC